MNNTYILAGEEVALKDEKIKDILKDKSHWNYRKIILDNAKKETVDSVIKDSFMYLTTLDMFNMNNKILNLVVDNAKNAVDIFTELIDYVDENILILDIRNTDIRSLTSSSIYKKNSKKITLEKYVKLEEKTKSSTIKDIKLFFEKNNILFESEEVKDIYANCIYDNSDYSYTAIKQQLEHLTYFSDDVLTKGDIYKFVSISFNGNFFVLMNNIFSCKTKQELLSILDSTFYIFEKNDYISFVNIFIYTIKDYIRYSQKKKCKSPMNYYQFKSSNLKVVDADKLISDLMNISIKLRITPMDLKENLIMLIYNHCEF